MVDDFKINFNKSLLERNEKSLILDEVHDITIKYESTESLKKDMTSNEIRTSKYTYYNCIFKILYEQFSQVSNLYFLILGLLQVK